MTDEIQTENTGAQSGPPPDEKRRPLLRFVLTLLGWLFATLELVGLGALWFGPAYRRDPIVQQMLTYPDIGSIGNAISYMMGWASCGILAAIFGWVVYRMTRRTRGRVLIAVGLLTVPLAVAGNLRPSRAGVALPGGSARGEWSVLYEVTREFVGELQRTAANYGARVINPQVHLALAPARVDGPEKLAKSREDVSGVLNEIDNYSRTLHDKANGSIEAIRQSDLPAASKEASLRVAEEGLAIAMPRIDGILACEREAFAEMDSILEFLQLRQGRYSVSNAKLVFKDNTDSRTYNASITRYRSLMTKAQELRTSLQGQGRDFLNRLSQAAQTGGPFARSDYPAPTRGPEIALDAGGITLNGKPVKLPIGETALSEILGGPPSRRAGEDQLVRVWDTLGIAASGPAGDKPLDVVLIQLNRHHSYEDWPNSAFAGTLTLSGERVRDVDAPRSLNRRLREPRFECVDETDDTWEVVYPGFIVTMDSFANGLTEGLSFRAPDKTANPAKDEGRPPRF